MRYERETLPKGRPRGKIWSQLQLVMSQQTRAITTGELATVLCLKKGQITTLRRLLHSAANEGWVYYVGRNDSGRKMWLSAHLRRAADAPKEAPVLAYGAARAVSEFMWAHGVEFDVEPRVLPAIQHQLVEQGVGL